MEVAMVHESILWFLLIGVIAGWLAGLLVKGRGFGFLGDLIVGILGALLGGFIFGLLGVAAYGLAGSLIMAVVGASVLLFLVRVAVR
jgi:uncharacterized membrane protein YeaQ/YmgE (transglycosylase-associated protein family)